MPSDPPPVCAFEPRDPQDVVLIEMTLSGTDIVYHIDDEGDALAHGGPAVGNTRMRLLVRADHAAEATSLLRSVLPL